MSDRLGRTTEEVRQRLHAFGAERLLERLAALVDGHEESVVTWFDGEYDDLSADEVLDWSIEDLAERGPRAFVALTLDLAAYSTTDEDEPMSVVLLPAFARVAPNEPESADLLDWHSPDLATFVTAHAR